MTLTKLSYINAADIIDVDYRIIQAITKTEANGKATLKDGRLKILFEGHVFWKQLKDHGVNPATVKPIWGNVLYEDWTTDHYVGGAGEWDRWSKAVLLCTMLDVPVAAALNSASYGMFQTMGFNHIDCGYSSAHEMIADYNTNGEPAQLNAVIKLIKNKNWNRKLSPVVDVNGFVELYNGKGYKKNDYHIKFANNLKKLGYTNYKLTL